MGTCPSTPCGLSLGPDGELRLPKRSGCQDCFAGELLEGQEDNVNPIEMQASCGKVLSGPLGSRSIYQDSDAYYKVVVLHNEDFAKEVGDLSQEAARIRVEKIVRNQREKLRAGMRLSTGDGFLTFSYDPALQCLDARESRTLYPLATLHECAHIDRPTKGSLFELRTEFNDSEAVTFQFNRGFERAAFALTLHALALEACKEKWHVDWAAEGWDEDEDEEDDASTADPGTREASSSGSDTRDPASSGQDARTGGPKVLPRL